MTAKLDDVFLLHYVTTQGVSGIIGAWLHTPSTAEQNSAVSEVVGEEYPDDVTWTVKRIDLYADRVDGYGVLLL